MFDGDSSKYDWLDNLKRKEEMNNEITRLTAINAELVGALESLMDEYKGNISAEYNWRNSDEISPLWMRCKKALSNHKDGGK